MLSEVEIWIIHTPKNLYDGCCHRYMICFTTRFILKYNNVCVYISFCYVFAVSNRRETFRTDKASTKTPRGSTIWNI